MRIALVDTTKKPTNYPVALLKIGAWQKSLGNECQLYTNQLPESADEIWLSTIFTFDIPHSLGIVRAAKDRAPVVRVGGVAASLLPEHFGGDGIIVHRGLIPEAESFPPDYGLLPGPAEYSIAHTSRGCIRKCKFCMVHRLEPEFYNREWIGDVAPGTRRILFYDNNWLAKDIGDLRKDVDQIMSLVKSGCISSVDFNQGLDCRLVTDEIADLLADVPIKPVRFAFDGMHEDGHYQGAVRKMAARGHREFMTYVLYNFMDKPSDFYYRLRVSVELSEELNVAVKSFPMRYQPILEIDNQRGYVGKYWTEQSKRAFVAIRAQHSFGGQVSMAGGSGLSPLQEFEYWYGKDADEFDRLLSYPKIRQLAQRKKGALRIKRARQ